MKKLLVVVVLGFAFQTKLFAQDGVMINYGAGTREPSAILDLKSTNQGFLTPKVNIADLSTAAPVTSPAEGLIVYNENNGTGEGYYYWTGTEWTRLLNGNSAPPTGSGTLNYITKWTPNGTTLGNSQMFDDGTGVGIGTTVPKGKLEVIGDIWATQASNNDNAIRIRPGLSSGNQYGFADQHNNIMAFVNEQGTTNQAFVLGDVDMTNAATLFGVSITTGGINPTTGAEAGWSKRFEIAGNGTVKLNTYTTDGIVRTTGGDGTLSSTGGAIDLTSEVTGVLPVANGGSGTGTAFTPGSVIFAGTSGVYSEDNPNLFWNNTTNRLGIGTSAAPSDKLHVSSTGHNDIFSIERVEASQGNQFDFRITSNPNSGSSPLNPRSLTIMAEDSPADIAFITDATSNNDPQFVVKSSGNVGIGNTTPAERLVLESEELDDKVALLFRTNDDAAGTTHYDAMKIVAGWHETSSTAWEQQGLSFQGYDNSTWTTRMHIRADGNVGIAETDPDEKLHIGGGGNLWMDGTGTGVIGLGHGIRGANRAELHLHANGANSVSEIFFGHDGRTDANERWTISDRGDAAGILVFYEGPSLTSSGFEERMVLETGGNVGIGTTDPTQLLDVNGQIRMRTGASSGYIPVSSNDGTMTWTDPALVGTDDDDWAKVGGGLPSLTDDIYHTGNVGVGTSSPSVPLEVYREVAGATTLLKLHKNEGDIGATSQINVDFEFTDANANGTPQARIAALANTDESAGSGQQAEGTGDLLFYTASAAGATTNNLSEKMRVTATGNVGVNTTTPDAKLDVQVPSYGLPLTSGTTQTHVGIRISPPSTSGNVVLDMGTNGSTGTWLQSTLRTDLANTYPLLLNPNGGNIGIGNTSPAQRLDVTGNIMHTGGMMSRGSTYSSTWMQFEEHQYGNSLILGSGGLAILGAGESPTATNTGLANPSLETLYLTADGGIELKTSVNAGWATRVDAMSILANGNVGMGNTAPATHLEVGDDATSTDEVIRVSTYTGYAGLELYGDYRNTTEAGGAYVRLSQDRNGVQGIMGMIQVAGQDGSGNSFTGTFANGMVVGNKYNGHLTLGTNNTARITIEGGGDVGIGTTAPNARLDVQGGLAQFEGGMETDKRYYYFQRYGHTTSSNGWDDSETHDLGAWDFCAVGHFGFKNDESNTDEDDDVQCAVYPSGQGGSGEQTDYTKNFTQNHDQRPTWIMYFEAYADSNGITCAANCITFKH